jgi:predicted ArsR family transcriptional regulator
LAGNLASETKRGDLETRANNALAAMEAIGGAARLEKEEGKLFIRTGSCPLSTAVTEHPEVCQLAEALVGEIMGANVQERCDRAGSPRCSLEVTKKP